MRRSSRCVDVMLLVLCLAVPLAAQQGYRLSSRSVDVNTRSHWQSWTTVSQFVDISARGAVTPVRLATETNAATDAGSFVYEIAGSLSALFDNSYNEDGALRVRGGVKRAGTNSAGASRVMDGAMATFWEPDSSDALDSWWLELDLGRLVSASRIVIRFAEDTESRRSDPFLQFRVHTATGQNPFGDQSGALQYQLAGGTTEPNKDQREFVFDLDPTLTHTDGWTGRLAQYVRLQVTGRRGARAEEVSEASWQEMPAADRGVVENVWLIAAEERLVTADEYDALPAEQQGGHRFFRRERPRLAEVEVWTVGENVSVGLLDRGGTLIDGNPTAAPELAFDGSIQTNWNAAVFSTVGDIAGWGLLTVDLGALLRIDATRFITRIEPSGARRLYGYELRGSDGSVAPDGSLIWETLSAESRQLNQDTHLFEDRFEPRPLRFLEFRNMDIARRTNAHLGHRFQSPVTEFQVYSSGYIPEVVMTSGLVDLRDSRALRTIEWEAETPPGTAVQIRTRTGNDLREVNRYFLSSGEEVSKSEWDSKPSFFQGPVETETVPGPGWSNWSQTYLNQGERIRSPSPRRYLEIEARLLSDTPDTAAILQSIRIHTLPPVADELAAEISPKQAVPVGELIDFEMYLQPTFASSTRPGFDLLRLTAPARALLNLRGVDQGSEAELEAGSADAFTGLEGDTLLYNASGLELQINGQGTDTLRVRMPATTRSGSNDLLRLRFSSTVFMSGSTFQLEVANSIADTLWQEADPGDVVGDRLASGSGLTVLTALGGGSIRMEEHAGVFTPNGDGHHDTAVFEFAVLRINVDREVSVQLFDLQGRRVRHLSESRPEATGLYRIEWDGLDESGNLVPPGLYVARVGVDSDASGTDAIASVVGVAY
jgi:hypothetical protein